MKNLFIIFFSLFLSFSFATNTNISGTVNSYAHVTAMTSNTVTHDAASPAHTFVCGDRVLIIQMKGAAVTTTNNASFGTISAINNAGNYEMATVYSVSGTTITLTDNLSKSYTPATGVVQLIYVPHYEDASVTGVLTASAWNGILGGVISIEVDGDLTLNANIDASELGFRGGVPNPTSVSPTSATCFFGFVTNGVVGVNHVYTDANRSFAVQKGESIVTTTTNIQYGKGSLASGGGGGGIESGGGGGGSNYGVGGNAGGGNYTSCNCACSQGAGDYADAGGIGGKSLNTQIASNRIYLGGGSGAGNNGNGNAYYGGATLLDPATGRDGGGIILISANQIIGNGNSIISNGEDGYTPPASTDNFGGAGGGGGGSILLNVNQYSTSLNIEAVGGFGSTVRTASGGNNRRRGAGGGGGGGLIWFSNGATPGGVSTDVAGGARGLCYSSTSTLQTSHHGTTGAVGGVLYSLSITAADYESQALVSSTASKSNTLVNNLVYFSDNGTLAAVNSNGNNLGSTTITTTVGNNGPFPTQTGCGTGEKELFVARYYDIVPTSQPGSACDVRLFITNAELQAFVALTNAQTAAYKTCWGAVNDETDLIITVIHSDGTKEVIVPTVSYIDCEDIWQFDLSVSKFSTFYIHSKGGVYDGNLLPVELLSFEAKSLDNGRNNLNWVTATEFNNSGFEVQRSFDGVHFEKIAWVEGFGNSNSTLTYELEDEVERSNTYKVCYYRLKQIDFNGEFEYSEIKSLSLVGEKALPIVNLYPNPANYYFVVDGGQSEIQSISIFNIKGDQLENLNLKAVYKHQINTTDLPNGVYFVKVVLENKVQTIRLIVQH